MYLSSFITICTINIDSKVYVQIYIDIQKRPIILCGLLIWLIYFSLCFLQFCQSRVRSDISVLHSNPSIFITLDQIQITHTQTPTYHISIFSLISMRHSRYHSHNFHICWFGLWHQTIRINAACFHSVCRSPRKPQLFWQSNQRVNTWCAIL